MGDPKRKSTGFSDFEREAMKERQKELRAQARTDRKREDGVKEVLDALNEMPANEKAIGMKIHEIVTKNAPELMPKTWYGMPAYANKDEKVVLFYQGASKFKYRYSTLGFQDAAKIDEGTMWPTSFAITKLSAADEARITELVKKAIS